MMKRLKDWLHRKTAPPAPAPKRDTRRRKRMGEAMLASALARAIAQNTPQKRPFAIAEPYPGTVPADYVPETRANDNVMMGYLNQCESENSFMGYQYLAQLSQVPEYRKMALTLADEMTRKWIKIVTKGSGDSDLSAKIEKLGEAVERYQLRKHIRKCIELDAFFGRSHLYIAVKTPGGSRAADDPNELDKPLFTSDKKVGKDSLEGFVVVEPVWTYPGLYNSTNPLANDYYRPQTWFVMNKTVHASRLMNICANPVTDMLKAAYSFGGLSLSQLAYPYVNNWLRTRQAVSDIVHCFSTSGISTNMEDMLAVPMDNDTSGEGEPFTDIFTRVKLYNELKDNKGMLVLNKETEEFFQFNVPLSGLDALQAQSQEQMSAVSSIPLVKLLGISPAGLNATSDGEIRVFYDYIHSQQEKVIRDPLSRAIDIIQLSEFGTIDERITFEFIPLYQLSEKEMADTRKAEAEADGVLIDEGIITAQEARERVIHHPDSPYSALEEENDELDSDDDGSPEEEGEGSERADTSGTASR